MNLRDNSKSLGFYNEKMLSRASRSRSSLSIKKRKYTKKCQINSINDLSEFTNDLNYAIIESLSTKIIGIVRISFRIGINVANYLVKRYKLKFRR